MVATMRSLTMIRAPNSLVSPSRREARFTALPITVPSIRSCSPTMPRMTFSECTPMPTRMGR